MSLRTLIVFLACLLSGATALAQTPAAAPAKDPRIGQIISQLEAVRAPHQTALSPDGKSIAWVVRAQEGRGSVIEVAPVDNAASTFQVTACAEGKQGEENEIAWSPDSKKLAFFSDCNAEKTQGLYLAEPDAKAPARRLVGFHGYANSPQWSPDGKFIGLLYVEGATRPSGALAAMKPPAGVIGVEGLEIQRVAAVDAASGELSSITPEKLHVYEFSWSPDSMKLAYVAAPPPGENNWWVGKLYTQARPVRAVTKSGGQVQFEHSLTSAPEVLVDPTSGKSPVFGLQFAVPRWSPDGSQIAFIAGLMSDQGSTGGDVYLVPSGGGEPKNITPESKTTAAWIEWLSNTQLGVSHHVGGESAFRSIPIIQGSADSGPANTELLRMPASIGDGRLSMSLSLSRDHDVAFISSSFENPPEVYLGKLGHAPQPLTHYNDNLKPSWGKSESVTWQNDGYDVQGWLLYPANYDAAKKYPLIVMVHGGPSAVATPHWPGAGFGAAPFSALGYFVLEPNPRGSYGQGEKFTQANRKDFGYGDLRDILAGVHTVANKYSVDPERVGITGWSYGGFMTMFAVTQTDRFRAAVAGAGIANWQSYYGENSIDQWMIPFFGASVYDDPAVYAKSSAINFIHKVKTPTLVVVGDRDGECPMPQSFEFWHALRDQHVPTELVVYPNEGHHFVSRNHQLDVLERALSWFAQYMPAQ